jgi:hypothetical protein
MAAALDAGQAIARLEFPCRSRKVADGDQPMVKLHAAKPTAPVNQPRPSQSVSDLFPASGYGWAEQLRDTTETPLLSDPASVGGSESGLHVQPLAVQPVPDLVPVDAEELSRPVDRRVRRLAVHFLSWGSRDEQGQAGCWAGAKNSVSASASTLGWVRGAACPTPGISCIRALGTWSTTCRALAMK